MRNWYVVPIIIIIILAACESTAPPPADPSATHYESTVPGLPVPGGRIGGLYRAVDVSAQAPAIDSGDQLQRYGLQFLRWGGIVAAITIAAHLVVAQAGPLSVFISRACEWSFAAAVGLSVVGLWFIGLGRYLWIVLPSLFIAGSLMWYFRKRGITAPMGKDKGHDDE